MLNLFFNFKKLCYTKNMEKSSFKKSLLYVLGLGAVALFSMFMFSACLFTLDTPQISRVGGVIKWDPVDSASAYNVCIEKDGVENVIKTNKTVFNISNYIEEAGTYKIKVQATSNSIIRNNSSYSQAKTIVTDGNIASPDAFKLTTKSNQVIISFQNTIYAETYTIKIVDPGDNELEPIEIKAEDTTVTYEIDISKYLTDAGDYKISVKANKTNDDDSISSSAYTTELTYTKTIPLFAPSVARIYDENGEFSENIEGTPKRYNENINYVGDNLVITFNEIGNASKYIVSLYGTDEEFSSTTNVVSIPKAKLPKITTDPTVDKTAIQIIHAQVKSNSLYFNSSDYSEGYVFFNDNINKSNLSKFSIKNPYYSFTGDEEFDFCADSQSELNTMVYFAMANRIGKIPFYQTYYTQEELTIDRQSTWFMNQNYISTATKEYYETKNILTSTVEDTTGKLMLYIDNKITGSPTETATLSKNGTNLNKGQVVYNDFTNYSKLEKTDANRYSVTESEILANEKLPLPIISSENAVNVYTSDQLYLAVQGGNYPVFVGETQAKQIWNKAVDVLVGTETSLGIIDGTMTDTQKALAIFDWVCYHNNYDYNLASLNEELVQRYRGFYMEGIFLDDGQAVCDGIAKTYSLLCNMAGVNCYKVSGQGTTNNGQEGHAWNKVGIYDDVLDKYDYYLVDCTWNDISVSDIGGNYALVHKYFLTRDDGKHLEQNPTKLSGNTLNSSSYDYFANTNVTLNGREYKLLINNDTSFGGDPWTYMSNLWTNLEEEYSKNENTGLNYLELKILNEYAVNFRNAGNSDWYIFSPNNDTDNTTLGYTSTGYTTYIVIHK